MLANYSRYQVHYLSSVIEKSEHFSNQTMYINTRIGNDKLKPYIA